MKRRLAVLPWEPFTQIKAFTVFQSRVSMTVSNCHYAKATIVRSKAWKRMVIFVVSVKHFRKKVTIFSGRTHSVIKAKQYVDQFLRDNNVVIKTKKQIERLQVMK